MDPYYPDPHYSFGPIYTRSISKTEEGYHATGVRWGSEITGPLVFISFGSSGMREPTRMLDVGLLPALPTVPLVEAFYGLC